MLAVPLVVCSSTECVSQAAAYNAWQASVPKTTVLLLVVLGIQSHVSEGVVVS